MSLSALAEGGKTKLSLGLEGGLGYNSNPYSLTDAQTTGKAVGDMTAKIAPRISLTMEGSKLALGIDGNANMGVLFGLNSNPGFLLFSGGANGSSSYNRSGSVSFFTQGGLSASRSLGELFVGNMTNLTGKASLGSTIRPGGGKFSLTVQGEYAVQGYPGLTYQGTNTEPRRLNNQAYYLSSRLSWLFLPKTSLYAEARYGFYENLDMNDAKITVNPLWVGGGLSGQITSTLSANLSAHFSKMFMSGPQTFASTSIPFGAKIGLDWKMAPHSSLSLNLAREIAPAPVFLDQASNSLTATYSQTMWEKFVLTVAPQGGLIEYGKPYTSASLGGTSYRVQDGVKNRLDFYTSALLGLSYSLKEWLALGISGEGFWRWTNTDPAQALSQAGWVAIGDGTNYRSLFSRYQGNVFVRLTY